MTTPTAISGTQGSAVAARAHRTTLLVLWRQVRAAMADPGPSFVLPMMPSLLMLVVFTSVFDDLGNTEGFNSAQFTSTTWDAYVAPGVVVLVALLGAGYTSSSLAADLRSGYAQRMSLAGVRTWTHLTGRLLFEAVRLLPGALVVVAVSAGFGAELDNGPVGLVVALLLVAGLGVAFTGVFFIVAIATEDPQTPFTLQPLGLPLAFLSPALVPLAIMPTWSEAIARFNPVSVVVDAARNAFVGQLWSTELATAAAVLGAWIAVTQLIAWRTLDAKLMRT